MKFAYCKTMCLYLILLNLAAIQLICLTSLSAQSLTIDCNKLCEKPKREKAYIEIDANTGKIVGGTTRFKEGQQVQVIIVNKNPFKYSYRFQIVSVPLETAIASSFLSFIPGFGNIIKQTTGEELKPLPIEIAGALIFDNDPNEGVVADQTQAAWDTLRSTAMPLTEESSKIKVELKKKETINEQFDKFIKDTENDNIDCEAACEAAKKLLPNLGELTKLQDISNKINDLKPKVDLLKPLIDDFKAKAKNQVDRVEDDLKKIEALSKDITQYEEAVKKLNDNKESFEHLNKIIKTAFTLSGPFVEVHYPPNIGGPTGVRITIYRKNLRVSDAKEEFVNTIPLQIGESLLSLSGGIGVSTVDNVKIIRQASLIDTNNVGTRFGHETNSSFQPIAVIMLNGHIFRDIGGKDITFALSTGLVINATNTEIEYIFGGSFGFLRNNLFVTFGGHVGKVEELAGGFQIGQEVPDNLSDPIPTEKNPKLGFVFAITYKLR